MQNSSIDDEVAVLPRDHKPVRARMDLTDQNFETISSIQLHNMTVDELAEAEKMMGTRLHYSDGVWWRQVKPFFYLPANFMTQVVPRQSRPKPWLALGGYYHMVPAGAPSNGAIVTNEIADPANYGLLSLQAKKRQQVRRLLTQFRIARVERLNDLLTDGFRIYQDWEKRKKPRVKRSNPAVFEQWVTRLFHHPHQLILGVYDQNRMVAFLTAEAVDGVANATEFFSDSSYARLAPSVALRYAYAKIATQTPGITKVCDGFRSLIDSLENLKALLGFQHVSYPTFISMPQVFRPLVRLLFPTEYHRLMSQYQAEEPSRQGHSSDALTTIEPGV